MEIHPDYDAREVVRTVAHAVSNHLHKGGVLNNSDRDSSSDETPLTHPQDTMDFNKQEGRRHSDENYLWEEKKIESSRWFGYFSRIPARYVLTIMGFLGFCNVYALRVNLSVALVAMINSSVYSNQSKTDACPVTDNTTIIHTNGKYLWEPDIQSMILGSFFYGYIVTQIPGGRMAELIGGKWLFGIGVLCTSIFTLLTPLAAEWDYKALIVLRVLEGLGEGVTFPAMHAMLGRWLPKLERGLLSTIIYSGAQIGTVISMPISGLLCSSDFLGGWPSVFYVFGILGCVWFVFWTWLIYEKPGNHPRISKKELMLIQKDTLIDEPFKEQPKIPWYLLLRSVPVWALILTHFGQNWGFYTLLTELPTYLSVILHYNIKANGGISALPYLLQAISSWTISYFADMIRSRKIAKINTIRKVCNSIGFFGPAICFFGVALAGCHDKAAVAFLTLAMGLNGATYSGFMVTHVDMSPTFAGTLMGMTNAVANITGILAPIVVGALTKTNPTLHQWQIVFYIAVAVYIAAGFIFVLFGSARLQPWEPSQNKPSDTSEDKNKEKMSDVDN